MHGERHPGRAHLVSLLVAMRLLGKREFGELSPFELVTLLMVPEVVSTSLTRQDESITGALLGVATLFALVLLTSFFTHKSKRFEEVVQGRPAVLVERGRLVPGALNRERMTPDELVAEMHQAGFEELSQVKWAVLEGDGRISFIPMRPEERQPGPPREVELQ